ncbi:MAG: hypothetical protein AAB389_04980 [Patescibacteria group bacterium]
MGSSKGPAGTVTYGETKDVFCNDCGVLGVQVEHWGRLVPDQRTGHFCIDCWIERQEYFGEHKTPKPMPDLPPVGESAPKDDADQNK